MKKYTDQEFLYRQTPVNYDGIAKFTSIKGNTLAFNQLAPTLASGNYSANRSTIAYSNNVATVTTNGNDGFGFYRNIATVVGHEYLFTAKVKLSKVGSLRLGLDEDSVVGNRIVFSSTAEKTVSRTWTCATANSPLVCYYYNNAIASGDNYTITNLMVIDLTLMGLTSDQFKSYFPLPYYSYQSTLLPFKGTGIKTVGKNLLPKMTSSVANGITWTVNDDGTVVANGTASANSDSHLTVEFTLLEGNYYFNGCPDGGNDSNTWNCYMWDLTTGTRAKQWDRTSNVLNNTNSAQSRQFYSNGTNRYAYNCRVMRNQTVSNLVFKPMVRLSSADDIYEPYTSHTTNLPTLTYFPNGMKSAGNVYDELLPKKAITRVGAYTITSFQAKSGATANNLFSINAIVDLIKRPSADTVLANFSSNYGEAVTMMYLYSNDKVGVAINNYGVIYVGFGLNGSVTTLAQANAYVQSNPITVYYELKTPTETDINTATLVTERGEIPLYRFGSRLYGDCVKAVSKHPGIIDGKVRLINSDGVAYSNKVMIRIERSTK